MPDHEMPGERSGAAGADAGSAAGGAAGGAARHSSGRTYSDEDQTIFEALAREHQTIASLFDQLVAEVRDDREQAQALFLLLKDEFLGHAWAEDEVFYGRLADAEDEELMDAVEELRAEHASIEELLMEAEWMEPSAGSWPARILALQEAIGRHVDKEERTIFEVAAELLGGDEQRLLARELHAAREQIAAEMAPASHRRRTALSGARRAEPMQRRSHVARTPGEGSAHTVPDVDDPSWSMGHDVEQDVEGVRAAMRTGDNELHVEFDVEQPTALVNPPSVDMARDRADEPETSVDDVDQPHRPRGTNEPIE